MDKFYITTAIAYTSRKPHIGNSYEIVLTDAIARFQRMRGRDVFFLTGTDEHGQKVEELAKAAGVSPKEYVDGIAGEIRRIADLLNTSYDKFIRTTDDYHERAVSKMFTELFNRGEIYKGEYAGMYCVPCESFWTQSQLVDGKCPDCGREVKPAKEEAYFLRLSKYQDWLIEHIESHLDFILPESRRNEMLGFLKQGLQDLCVSRTSFKWGIPVDFDQNHVIYVWLDALSNYITALGYAPGETSELFEKYWPCDIHMIGKDILRFHTIYWPIMLKMLDLPLPKQVFGHPWLLVGQDKMSKSRGNVIYADDLIDLFGVDAVRYYVLSEMPFAQDGSITYETIIERYNSDLANTLGNLVNRTVAMTNKYFGGVIPSPTTEGSFDGELRAKALETVGAVAALMEKSRVADALEAFMELARRCNKYIDETEPWALAKDEANKERLGTVLYNLLESIRFLGALITPFLPGTADAILAQIGAEERAWDTLTAFGALKPGSKVEEAKPLFARIDAKEMLARIEAQNTPPIPEVIEEVPPVSLIGIEDFAKVQLKTAKITACEPVPKSDKLLRLQLDDGEGGRQVVSGIAKWYQPADLIGRTIILVANLKPAKLRGVESQGMILAADTPEGGVSVLFANGIAPGSNIH